MSMDKLSTQLSSANFFIPSKLPFRYLLACFGPEGNREICLLFCDLSSFCFIEEGSGTLIDSAQRKEFNRTIGNCRLLGFCEALKIRHGRNQTSGQMRQGVSKVVKNS